MKAHAILIQTEVFTNFPESVTEDVSLCERPARSGREEKTLDSSVDESLKHRRQDECKSIFLTAFRRLGRLSFSSPCALGDVHS